MSTIELQPTQASDPMLPRWSTVQRVHRENHDTFTLELSPPDDEMGFVFAPGQFNMLYVFGVGEVPISISGDSGQSDRIVHTVRSVGTVTRALWGLKRGDTVGLRGPFGSAWPSEAAYGRDLVIVAGGIGLAPLRPVLYFVTHHPDKFNRVLLLYGARTPDDLLYVHEALKPSTDGAYDVDVSVDKAVSGWDGKVGVVTTLIPPAEFNAQEAIAFICGPEIMIRFTVSALAARGLAHDRIYLSMERNMKCAVGFCGHCQYGPEFICKDGPVFRYDRIQHLLGLREL